MATIDGRVAALEKAAETYTGPLVLFADGEPTEEQARAIAEAERIGRAVVVVRWLDAAL